MRFVRSAMSPMIQKAQAHFCPKVMAKKSCSDI